MAYMTGASSSIEEAKMRNTYCYEYLFEIKPDSIRSYWGIDFKEIFLEKQFKYGRKWSQTILDQQVENKFRIICVLNEEGYLPNISFDNVSNHVNDFSNNFSSDSSCKRVKLATFHNSTITSNILNKSLLSDSLNFEIYKKQTNGKRKDMVKIKIGAMKLIIKKP